MHLQRRVHRPRTKIRILEQKVIPHQEGARRGEDARKQINLARPIGADAIFRRLCDLADQNQRNDDRTGSQPHPRDRAARGKSVWHDRHGPHVSN